MVNLPLPLHVLAFGPPEVCLGDRLLSLSESSVHFERACQLMRESSLPEMPGKVEARDLLFQYLYKNLRQRSPLF